MSYRDDLDECIRRADIYVEELEKCLDRGWLTSADVIKMNLNGVIKSAKYCVGCVKRKMEQKGLSFSEFECSGGCIRPRDDAWFAKTSEDQGREFNRILRLFRIEPKQGIPTKEDNQ